MNNTSVSTEPRNEPIAASRRDLGVTILRNSVAITAGEWVAKVLNFVFTVYAVRLLGETGWGRYATVVAFVGLFGVFFELGMSQYVERTIAQDRTRARDLYWNVVVLRLILATIGIFVITSLSVIVGHDRELMIGVMLWTGTFAFASVLTPLANVLTANERFDLLTVLLLLAQLLNIGLSLLFLSLGAGFLGLLYTGYVVMPAQILLCVWAIRRLRLGGFQWRIDPKTWRPFIRASLPFALSSIALTYSFNVDTVMLGFFYSSGVVGWYNAAYKLVFNLTAITGGFQRAITPSFARENMTNPERVRNWSRLGIQGMLLIALPIAVGVSLLGTRIVDLLYGAAFAPSGLILSIIIWDVPLLTFNAFCGNLTTALGLERPASRIYLLSTLVGIALYVVLIPPFGMIAAAVITVFMDSLTATRFFMLLRNHIELDKITHKLALTTLSAGLMGGVVILTSSFELFIVILAGAATYGAFVLAFGLFNWSLFLATARRFVRR
ncbi:MAG: oligosaccharide flippase family protein [Chloroflexi bacterium]|nr:oligosaccharide flippase family protein [Chloroflexota bacterium]